MKTITLDADKLNGALTAHSKRIEAAVVQAGKWMRGNGCPDDVLEKLADAGESLVDLAEGVEVGGEGDRMMPRHDLEAIRKRQSEVAPAFDYKVGDLMFEDITTVAQMATDARDLLALVELQTRALLAVEWKGGEFTVCPACDMGPPYEHPTQGRVQGHNPSCPLDAALTDAGLDTHEKRDAARKAGR